MIEAIIFDCFGVLTTDLWKEFVSSLPDEQREPARQLNRAYDRGQLTRSEFLKEIDHVTSRRPAEVEGLLDSEIDKNTELLSYVAELRTHYRIGLLSNVATSWVTDTLLTTEEQGLFDAMVFSYQIGITKPDPAAYETVASRLGVPAEACVMVDDIEYYCRAAEDLGMRSVQYKNFSQFRRALDDLLPH